MRVHSVRAARSGDIKCITGEQGVYTMETRHKEGGDRRRSAKRKVMRGERGERSCERWERKGERERMWERMWESMRGGRRD